MKRYSSSNMELRSYKRKSFQTGSSSSDASESEINILDDQLAEIIFKYVPVCQWSSCVEYVSRKFRRCVMKAYSRLKFINFKTLFSLKLPDNNVEMENPKLVFTTYNATVQLNKVLKKLLSVCPNLADIAGFEYVASNLNTRSTWNILKKFDRLQSISFEGAIKMKSKYFHDFVVGHKTLKNLKFCSVSFVGRGTPELDVGTLSSLVCRSASNAVLLENPSEKLTSFTLDGFQRYFKSADYAEQALKLCVNLESLSVRIENMDDRKLLFNVLPHLCKLTELRLFGLPNRRIAANVFGEEFCTQLNLIKNQLKFLEIRLNLSDELQWFLFTECLNLQSLTFSCITSLSTNVLKKLVSLPGKLEELTFSDNDGESIPLLLPKLVRLSNFTDLTIDGNLLSEGWENICCLVHLRNLRLYGGFIDDSVLEKWNTKNDKMFENLVTLEMPYCSGISDVGGCLFAKKAKNLQILDLTFSKIGDKTISILADVAKNLTRANIYGCIRLDDEKFYIEFIKKAACLKKLDLGYLMAKRVIAHKDFVPFVENVEIACSSGNYGIELLT